MLEIACQNCQAACCHDGVIELTRQEQKLLQKGGTKLVTIAKPKNRDRQRVLYPHGSKADDLTGETIPLFLKDHPYESLEAGLGRFLMVGSCGYLETDENGWQYCNVYDRRPKACQDFEVGAIKCRLMRVLYGIDQQTDGLPDLNNFDLRELVEQDQLLS